MIAASTAIRIGMAAGIGLGIDESYMVVAGRGAFRLGYFDHPLVSWWLSHGAALLLGETALAVRLPFILLFALSSWLMFRLTVAIATPRAGLWAAIAFNLAPVFGVTTGGWVLPDGPLVCALLGMALCLVQALAERHTRWWLAAGLCAGLAMLSKYTAVLSIAGFFLYLLTQPVHRRWLGRWQPYAASVLAAAVFAPVIVWNAQNGWASLAFQGGRAAAARLQPFGPLATLGGEALFLLPWIWAGLILVWWRGLRAGPQAWTGWLLACLAALPIILFAVVALWSRQVLFHWAAPGYLMLFPLLGMRLAGWRWAPRVAYGTAALLAVGLGLVVSEVRLGWLPLKDDPAAQARDWTPLRPALAARGLLGLPIAAPSWSDAGKIGIGLGPDVALFCLNADAREFRFATLPPSNGDVLIVAPRRTLAQMQAAYGAAFARIDMLEPVQLDFGHGVQAELPLFVARGLIQWPRP